MIKTWYCNHLGNTYIVSAKNEDLAVRWLFIKHKIHVANNQLVRIQTHIPWSVEIEHNNSNQ